MEEKIRCKTCKNVFMPIFENSGQGINCDAEIDFKNNEIQCFYGSDFDTDVYEFTNGEVPDFVEAGLICDDCLAFLLREELITFKETKTWILK